MTKDVFLYPIPENKLIKRFQPIFKKASSGCCATFVSLPFTGRTSHFRFILSQKELLAKLGVNLKSDLVSLIDIDKTTYTLESFLRETINSLKISLNLTISYTSSDGAYLLSQELFSLIAKITEEKNIILIVTLNEKVTSLIPDIDKLIALTQKSTTFKKLTIIWSIDTIVLKNYIQGHPSSTFLDNVYYFSTFSKEETLHSIKRIALTKAKKIPIKKLSEAFNLTGGISGLFHLFVNSDSFQGSDSYLSILSAIKREISKNESLSPVLITKTALKLVNSHNLFSLKLNNLKFSEPPTSEDLVLTNLFTNYFNKPVSRDLIAQTLWGKKWESKYSDWAIDKAISRLRKKIKLNDFKIITIKNLGYQLYKIQ